MTSVSRLGSPSSSEPISLSTPPSSSLPCRRLSLVQRRQLSLVQRRQRSLPPQGRRDLSFFVNTSGQVSSCDRRLSLSSCALFRPKVDEISLLTINTTNGFSPMRLFERLRTCQNIDLDEVRSIGEEGLGAMAYLEKWLRKRPPMDPNQPQAEQVDPLNDPADEVDNAAAQDPVDPLIRNHPIPEIMDAGTSYVPQFADGGSVSSSFTAHLGSMPSYPLTPMFHGTSPQPIHTDMAYDSQEWFDYPLQNAELHVEVDVQGSQGDGDGVVTQVHGGEQDVHEDQDLHNAVLNNLTAIITPFG